MLPRRVQSVLIIIVGLALFGYFAYDRSAWLGLMLDSTQRRGAEATLIKKQRVASGGLTGIGSTTGVVMTVEYRVDGKGYRSELDIQNFRRGVDAVRIGQTVPILYNASDPSAAIFAADLKPGAEEWSFLVLGLCFIGLGVAKWREEDH